jgi:hypothetical protein
MVEKRKLIFNINKLPPAKIGRIVDIVQVNYYAVLLTIQPIFEELKNPNFSVKKRYQYIIHYSAISQYCTVL